MFWITNDAARYRGRSGKPQLCRNDPEGVTTKHAKYTKDKMVLPAKGLKIPCAVQTFTAAPAIPVIDVANHRP